MGDNTKAYIVGGILGAFAAILFLNRNELQLLGSPGGVQLLGNPGSNVQLLGGPGQYAGKTVEILGRRAF
jgi:hypothetical protein